MITHSDIGNDEDRARRVLVRARDLAPGIELLDPESEDGKNAIAILKGVLAELPASGSRRTRSMSRNGSSISLDVGSAFTDDDIASLRALCRRPVVPGLPMGSFPEAGIVAAMWPEREARR